MIGVAEVMDDKKSGCAVSIGIRVVWPARSDGGVEVAVSLSTGGLGVVIVLWNTGFVDRVISTLAFWFVLVRLAIDKSFSMPGAVSLCSSVSLFEGAQSSWVGPRIAIGNYCAALYLV